MNNAEYNAIKSQAPVATQGAHGVFAGLAGQYFVSRTKDGHPMIPQAGKYTLEQAMDEMAQRAGAMTLTQICAAVIARCTPLIEAGAATATEIERASEAVRREQSIQADDWPSTMICQRVYPHFGLKFTPLSDEEWAQITQSQSIE